MSERLTDEQIDSYQRYNPHNGAYGNAVIQELISDLRHYKQLAEERGKTLTIVRDTLQHKKNDDRTSWGLWDLSNKALEKETESDG